MTNKVYLDPGHGGSDPGAVKYLKEKDVNLTMALACRDYLQAHGVSVRMSRTGDTNTSINAMARDCNLWKAELAVSIHNNAGGGDGFEVFHHYKGGRGKTLSQNIEAEVKAIGQNSRGLKTRRNSSGTDYFGFIRLINCPSIICEGVFVDNRADASQADTPQEQRNFGYAYARGILKTLGIADKGLTGGTPGKPSSGDGFLVKVTAKVLNIRAGAGTGYRITGQIKDNGVYTIVARDGNWGKLKSGVGWIHLGYVKVL